MPCIPTDSYRSSGTDWRKESYHHNHHKAKVSQTTGHAGFKVVISHAHYDIKLSMVLLKIHFSWKYFHRSAILKINFWFFFFRFTSQIIKAVWQFHTINLLLKMYAISLAKICICVTVWLKIQLVCWTKMYNVIDGHLKPSQLTWTDYKNRLLDDFLKINDYNIFLKSIKKFRNHHLRKIFADNECKVCCLFITG